MFIVILFTINRDDIPPYLPPLPLMPINLRSQQKSPKITFRYNDDYSQYSIDLRIKVIPGQQKLNQSS
jgi:hypothetical protein